MLVYYVLELEPPRGRSSQRETKTRRTMSQFLRVWRVAPLAQGPKTGPRNKAPPARTKSPSSQREGGSQQATLQEGREESWREGGRLKWKSVCLRSKSGRTTNMRAGLIAESAPRTCSSKTPATGHPMGHRAEGALALWFVPQTIEPAAALPRSPQALLSRAAQPPLLRAVTAPPETCSRQPRREEQQACRGIVNRAGRAKGRRGRGEVR